jgi:pimeloyl-ACP methyl ester carboxylesterase
MYNQNLTIPENGDEQGGLLHSKNIAHLIKMALTLIAVMVYGCSDKTRNKISECSTERINSRQKSKEEKGYFKCGIPYNRTGNGSRIMVVFNGLIFENKPLPNFAVTMYDFLDTLYTVYIVSRKTDLPQNYTLKDMADDYAVMVGEEFGGCPVDIIGLSTGGSIAHHFAADHPDLVRRLIIQSSAYTLSDDSRAIQMKVAELAEKKQWMRAYAMLIGHMVPHHGIEKVFYIPLVWGGAFTASRFMSPKNPSDLIVTIRAEDKFNFEERLTEINVPTLLIAGRNDPFYPEELFRKTASKIHNCKLVLYPNMGHPATGKQFERDVLAFLCR